MARDTRSPQGPEAHAEIYPGMPGLLETQSWQGGEAIPRHRVQTPLDHGFLIAAAPNRTPPPPAAPPARALPQQVESFRVLVLGLELSAGETHFIKFMTFPIRVRKWIRLQDES